MYKQKIGISIGNGWSLPIGEVLQMIKSAGFEAVSPEWKSREALAEFCDEARRLGLEIQSLHAPFSGAADMWSDKKDALEPIKNELLEVIDACVDFQIPITVLHTWIGFDYKFEKESLYYKNYEEVVSYGGEEKY